MTAGHPYFFASVSQVKSPPQCNWQWAYIPGQCLSCTGSWESRHCQPIKCEQDSVSHETYKMGNPQTMGFQLKKNDINYLSLKKHKIFLAGELFLVDSNFRLPSALHNWGLSHSPEDSTPTCPSAPSALRSRRQWGWSNNSLVLLQDRKEVS